MESQSRRKGSPRLRERAYNLAQSLNELTGHDYSTRQDFLLKHAWGLLRGIADGNITTSQPQLFDTLLEFAESLDKDKNYYTVTNDISYSGEEVRNKIGSVVGAAAIKGFSASNNPIKEPFRQR